MHCQTPCVGTELERVDCVFKPLPAMLVMFGLGHTACDPTNGAAQRVNEPEGSEPRSLRELDYGGAESELVRGACDAPAEAGCLGACPDPHTGTRQIWLQSFSHGAPELTGVTTDPDANVMIATAGGGTKKLDPSGVLVWAKPFGTLVAADAAGNVYVAGTVSRALELGAFTLTPTDASDAYVVKLSPAGEVIQGAVFAAEGEETLLGFGVDASGAGAISGKSLGLVKFDTQGGVVWSRPFSGPIAVDASGNIALTGGLRGSLDLGNGELTSSGGEDVLVALLDAAGNQRFSRVFGDAGPNQRGEAVAFDRDGHILVSGVLDGVVDFGLGELTPRAGACPSEVGCKWTGFIARFDATGNASFSVNQGPMRTLSSISSNSRGDVLVSGATPGGVSPYRIPLLLALDASGEELWRETEWPESGIGSGRALSVDACDSVIWSLSARPDLSSEEAPYLAKLSPNH
jgi:hypothetical protein